MDSNDPHGGHGYVGVGDPTLFNGEPLDSRNQTVVY